ncbi:DUF4157 domain-containing protein [Archangium lansingense]|uniref:eCIS core domain-containing protein n=1 Tax=Archangium lansingense TaxID=2995310 RepID=UPI003B7E6F35
MLLRHMESYFGADFSGVRLHLSPEPKRLGARAFTLGSHIFIDPQQYQPDTASGRELLAHELAHVLQQRSGRVSVPAGVLPIVFEDRALEAEAAFMGALAGTLRPAPKAFATPRGDSSRRATEATGIPAGVVQMARFSADGSLLNSFSSKVYSYHDTESPKAFGAWIDYLQAQNAQQTLHKLRTSLAQLRGGTRGERIAASRVQHALDVLSWAPLNGGYSALARLPRRRWWKIFIEGRHHAEPNGPLYFDLDQSPGFYDTMTRAFEQELLPKQGNSLIDAKKYDELHRLVVDGVLRSTDSKKTNFEPVPHQQSSNSTTFPMTLPPQVPNAFGLQEMELAGELGKKSSSTTATSLYEKVLTRQGEQYVIQTNYRASEMPRKVQALLDRYYKDLESAASTRDLVKRVQELKAQSRTLYQSSSFFSRTLSTLSSTLSGHDEKDDKEENERQLKNAEEDYSRNVLRAIVRLVRALHVGHFYTDANGRLNTMLLLNKLLLQNGFSPVILNDNAIFGGRMNIEQLRLQVEAGLKAFDDEVKDASTELQVQLVAGEVAATQSLLRQVGINVGVPVLGVLVTYYFWPS